MSICASGRGFTVYSGVPFNASQYDLNGHQLTLVPYYSFDGHIEHGVNHGVPPHIWNVRALCSSPLIPKFIQTGFVMQKAEKDTQKKLRVKSYNLR